MPGSAAGLARIDALFGGTGYQTTFSGSPVVFGAFPSLHAACATLEALFISHFFPAITHYVWTYAFILYWATMYLAHHYLIDVVAGASLAVLTFHFFMPASLRVIDSGAIAANGIGRRGRNKYEVYDLEDRRRHGGIIPGSPQSSLSSGRHSLSLDDEGQDIAYGGRSPAPLGSAAPFIVPSPLPHDTQVWKGVGPVPANKAHRHTASIASLIRADDRVETGWSPVSTKGFIFPPAKRAGGSGDSS
jgi:inositol phosphorylceramide synthase catalytic subunit